MNIYLELDAAIIISICLPVFLTEAHDTILATLSHANMVHHEQVDVNVGGACPSHCLICCYKTLCIKV